MKTYMGVKGIIIPLIINVGTEMDVVSFTHRPLFPQERKSPGIHWIRDWVGLIARLDVFEKIQSINT